VTETKDKGDGGIWIASTRTAPGSDLPSACLITWDGEGWYAATEDVRVTGVDLIEAATWANTMMVMAKLGLPTPQLSQFFGDAISKARKGREFGLPATIMLMPAGSTKRGKAVVLLMRGDKRAEVDSDVAVSMGQQWLEIAEAVDSDRVVVAALREMGTPDGIEALLFSKMFELRTAGAGPG
jgi:hypothetical protein